MNSFNDKIIILEEFFSATVTGNKMTSDSYTYQGKHNKKDEHRDLSSSLTRYYKWWISEVEVRRRKGQFDVRASPYTLTKEIPVVNIFRIVFCESKKYQHCQFSNPCEMKNE